MELKERIEYFRAGFSIFVLLFLVLLFVFYNFYALNHFSREMLSALWAVIIFIFVLLGIIIISIAYSWFIEERALR
jgi:hypothetical protein